MFAAVLFLTIAPVLLPSGLGPAPLGLEPPASEPRPAMAAVPGLPRAGEEVPVATFEGVWTLTDAVNHAFDVVLFPGGAARSNWSKGPAGARGEWGRWRPYGSGVRIDYDNGWIDLIRIGTDGFEQVSYSPDRPLAGAPSASGRAVRTPAEIATLVGVFELRMEQDGSPFCVAVQSSGLAYKTLPGLPMGTWTLDGGAAVIRWADGWTDAFRPLEGGRVEQRTWKPGRSVLDPPDAVGSARRLRDELPAALTPAGSPRLPG
jgi:hypothetical protein